MGWAARTARARANKIHGWRQPGQRRPRYGRRFLDFADVPLDQRAAITGRLLDRALGVEPTKEQA